MTLPENDRGRPLARTASKMSITNLSVVRCRRCSRPLTAVSSVRAGVGPVCERLAEGADTRGVQTLHTPDGEPTVDYLAEVREAAVEAFKALSERDQRTVAMRVRSRRAQIHPLHFPGAIRAGRLDPADVLYNVERAPAIGALQDEVRRLTDELRLLPVLPKRRTAAAPVKPSLRVVS